MPASGSVPYGTAFEMTEQRDLAHPSAAMHGREKKPTVEVQGAYGEDLEEQQGKAMKSTHSDIRGMHRMGKEQQLNRTFRQMSITSFVALATATWEIGLFIISPALVDGGRAGLVWSSLWSWICFAPIYLSMVCGGRSSYILTCADSCS